WLTRLLVTPNRFLTVAELRGDPEGKLAGAAHLGSELETDAEGASTIARRLKDIDDITVATGGSEQVENERTDLLDRLKRSDEGKRLQSSLTKQHHNIATQFRNFLKKLATEMPQLAAHLNTYLKLEQPDFGYFPPINTPAWKI